MKIIIQCLLILFMCACTAPREFSYRNPISNGLPKGGLRDCQVIKDKGKWYMTGTCAPVHVGANPGVSLYSSKDLLNWKLDKYIINRTDLDSSVWYYDRFWAPEIHKIKGKYYLLFNSKNETKEYTHDRGTCVAVAKKIKGPYKVITEEIPFSKGIDMNFFEDTDGKVYANWHEDEYIMGAMVDMKTMQPINSYIALSTGKQSWDSAGIEGSYMIKDKDTYYLFYSSWTRGYEIGYATSKSPMGPWIKAEDNPIYGAQDINRCKKYGGIYSGNPNDAFGQIGHNNVFKGPDGKYWLSCHGILKNGEPLLVIEPFQIVDGKIKIDKPTTKLKTIKW